MSAKKRSTKSTRSKGAGTRANTGVDTLTAAADAPSASFDGDGMRAVVTWGVATASPNAQQILVDIGICLPTARVRRLTASAVVIVDTNVNEINSTFLRLRQVANRFPGEVVVVLAGQMAEEVLFIHPASHMGDPLIAAEGTL